MLSHEMDSVLQTLERLLKDPIFPLIPDDLEVVIE